jgi:hypothetical protein
MEKDMIDSELDIFRAIKAPVRTKLEEILKLLKKDDFLSFAEDFGIVGRGKMNKKKLVGELCTYFFKSREPGKCFAYCEKIRAFAFQKAVGSSIFRKRRSHIRKAAVFNVNGYHFSVPA